MTDYLLTWAIDIFDSESPKDAAQRAADCMHDPRSIAHVFDVKGGNDMVTRVDLDQDEILDPVWDPSRNAVAELALWMHNHDWDFDEVVAMIRDPRRYADQYSQMVVDTAFDAVAQEPEEIEEVTYHGLTRAECLECGKVTTGATDIEIMNDLDPTCDVCNKHHVRWTREDGSTVDTSGKEED